MQPTIEDELSTKHGQVQSRGTNDQNVIRVLRKNHVQYKAIYTGLSHFWCFGGCKSWLDLKDRPAKRTKERAFMQSLEWNRTMEAPNTRLASPHHTPANST